MGVTNNTVQGGGAGGGGGGSTLTVSELIEREKPKKFFKMWELNTGANNLSDHGAEPSTALLDTGVPPPTHAAETPMVLDPTQTAPEFNGTTGHYLSTFANDMAGSHSAFNIGTIFAFFKLQTNPAGTQMIWSQGNAGGATNGELFYFNNAGTSELWVRTRLDGGANFMNSQLLPVGAAAIALNEWHMIGYRQPGLGAGCNCFWDGTFFTSADAELTNAVGGTGALDDWWAETLVAVAPAVRMTIGATPTTVPAGFLDGLIFGVMLDDVLWSDANLTAVWDRAIANGLNA
jgi:hypothetical protein